MPAITVTLTPPDVRLSGAAVVTIGGGPAILYDEHGAPAGSNTVVYTDGTITFRTDPQTVQVRYPNASGSGYSIRTVNVVESTGADLPPAVADAIAEATAELEAALATKASPADIAASIAALVLASASQRPATDFLSPIAERLLIVGHSLAAGGGAPTMGQAWHNLLAGLSRAELVNYGKGGAVGGWTESNVLPYGQTGDGGVGHVVSHLPRPVLYRAYKGAYAGGSSYAASDVVQTGAAPYRWWASQVDSNAGNNPVADDGTHWRELIGDQAHPYEPRGFLPIVWLGNNDLGWVGSTIAWLHGLRVVLSYLNAAEVTVRGADARCTYSGAGWAVVSSGLGPGCISSGVANGSRALGSNTTDVETAVTPGDWPGAYVSATYVVAGLSTAGVFRVQVDGQTVLTKDVSTGHEPVGGVTVGKGGMFALRFWVPAGAHTITIKQTTPIVGSGGFAVYTDGLILESPNPAPIIVPALFKFLTPDRYAAIYVGFTFASDAAVDAWNAILQPWLAAEFPNAVYHDVGITQDAARYAPDGVHQNAHGHALIAADLYALLSTTVAPSMSSEQRAVISRPAKTGKAVRLNFGWDCANAGGVISVATGSWQALSYVTSGGSGYTSGATRWIRGTVEADPGDVIELGLTGLWRNDTNAQGYVDFATMLWPNGLSRAAVANRWVSSEEPYNSAHAAFGLNSGQNGNPTVFAALLAGGPVYYRVKHDDLVFGMVTLQLHATALTAARGMYCSPDNRIHLAVRNVGQEQYYEGDLNAR